MDEKMKILEMLDAGKITPEQASELIKAIGDREPAASGANHNHHGSHSHHSSHSHSEIPRHNNGNGARPQSGEGKGLGIDEIAADLRVKLGSLAKEWEPKVKEIAGVVAEKTVDFADKVTKEVTKAVEPKPAERQQSSAAQSGMRSEPARPITPTARPGQLSERSFELVVPNAGSELVLAGFNAPVTVKGYNGDKITAKITYKAKQPNADIGLISYGNKFILNYDAAAFSEVGIDAYVPEKLFGIVNISNINAVLHASSISTEVFSVSTTGGKMELSRICAADGRLDAVNSVVTVSNLDIKNMKLETGNAPINLSMTDFTNFNDYMWTIETSNGRISANIPSTPSLGYRIKAASALGTVKLGLTNMEYSQNSAAHVEARSANFDTCAKRVSISFESSNDSIVIN